MQILPTLLCLLLLVFQSTAIASQETDYLYEEFDALPNKHRASSHPIDFLRYSMEMVEYVQARVERWEPSKKRDDELDGLREFIGVIQALVERYNSLSTRERGRLNKTMLEGFPNGVGELVSEAWSAWLTVFHNELDRVAPDPNYKWHRERTPERLREWEQENQEAIATARQPGALKRKEPSGTASGRREASPKELFPPKQVENPTQAASRAQPEEEADFVAIGFILLLVVGAAVAMAARNIRAQRPKIGGSIGESVQSAMKEAQWKNLPDDDDVKR